MNARPASAATAAAHESASLPAVGGVRQGLPFLPLMTQAVPIAGAFLCSSLLYGRLAGENTGLQFGLLAGIGSSMALFAQLRLIDDLDDLERDHPDGRCTAAWRSALRARLLAGLAACMALIVVFNFTKPHALMAAAAATALALAAPFGYKRLFPRGLALAPLVFEGAPLLVFAYCYFFWRDAGGPELPWTAAGCVALLFWTAYEFWKFSRKVHTTAMQPYLLSRRGVRAALTALPVLALAANLALARGAGLSNAYMVYAASLPLGWLLWLNASWPVSPSECSVTRRPLWAGTTFVVALELGLLLELLPLPGSR